MERRRCKILHRISADNQIYVDREMYGYFHCWEHYAEPVAPSPMKGGNPGGQYSQVYAIVEKEDGTVARVNPTSIQFIDEEE